MTQKHISEAWIMLKAILNDRETIKRLAIPFASVLVAIGVVAFFLIPTVKHITATYADMRQKEQELSIVTTKLSVLNELSFASVKSQFDQALQYLPAKKETPLFLFTLSNLEGQSGVQFQSVQTTPGEINDVVERTDDEFIPLNFTISGNGAVQSLKTLLSKLDTSPVFLRPVDMQFSRKDEGEGGTISLQVEAYILPQRKLDRHTPDLELSNEEREVLSRLSL